MTSSIVTQFGKTTLRATFAVAAIVLVAARAQAADPGQIDQVTVSSETVKVVGHDAATGAPIDEMMKTARIQYDPVTLTTNSGVALLKDSIQEAARKACYSIDPLDTDDATCVRNAVDSAMPQVNAAVARARTQAIG
jgi:UrcA family protein